MPEMYAVNASFGDGLLQFTTSSSLDQMLIKNAKSIDKSDDISRVLNGLARSSFVFMKNGKPQSKTKRYFRQMYKGENLKHLDQMVRRVSMDRLKRLQDGAEKKVASFNLTDEITETVGLFVFKAIFGEEIISEQDTVRLEVDGKQRTLPVTIAFRVVWRQTMAKMASMPRLFLFDQLTEWAVTPAERACCRNQAVIRQFFREKRAQHAEWRKENPIQNAEEDTIYMADLLMADERYEDEEVALDEIASAIFGLGQTTVSGTI